LTEQAAKTALVLPFLQALGYDVFNPSEVVPEFTADIGTKKGEKVDYAICKNGSISILIECKPFGNDLNINHAGQLFRYFSVTESRLAVLTNGVIYQFYSDIDRPNKMDDKPFFTFNLEYIKPSDIRTIEKFAKATFDIESIVQEAGNLKLQGLIRAELSKEFSNPSEDFVRLIASRVYEGRFTAAVKDNFTHLVSSSISTLIRDMVTDRLSSALNASDPPAEDDGPDVNREADIETTVEEISGFHIVQAIASRLVDPKRIVIRDAKSYCAILLDDNNRKAIVRLHFNRKSAKYLGTFSGRDETRHLIESPTAIYLHATAIEDRLRELDDML